MTPGWRGRCKGQRSKPTNSERNMSRSMIFRFALLTLMGCANAATQAPNLGELSLGLSTQAGGKTYRLTAGTLSLKGPLAEEIAVEGDDPLQRTLPIGSYTLELLPGWALSRIDAAGPTQVTAALDSQNPAQLVIGPGATTELALRFRLTDGSTVAMGTGMLDVSITLGEDDAGPGDASSCVSGLTINEIDYEQTGPDDTEFVEIINLAACAADLSEVSLELVNGGDGKVYGSSKLSVAGSQLAAGARLVVGAPRVLAALPQEILRAPLGAGGLQNGAPDAARLVAGTQALDAFSYEGSVPGAVEGGSAGADEGEGAFSRCPDGFDTGDNARDFRLVPPTPGAVNRCD